MLQMDNYYDVVLNIMIGMLLFCLAIIILTLIGYLTYELVMFCKEKKRNRANQAEEIDKQKEMRKEFADLHKKLKKLEKNIKDGKEKK
jgi:uncharacterized protein YlxW (UPF0749 family)